MFIFILRNQSRLEPENVLIVCEQFGHVLFWRLRLKTENTAKRIFRSSITVKRRNLLLDSDFLAFFNLDWNKLNAQSVPIVRFSEVISIIDDTISSENIHMLPNGEVLR